MAGGLQWQGGTLEMGLSWQGSEYELVLLPPGQFVSPGGVLPPGAITESNAGSSPYGVEFFDGTVSYGKPYKYFRVNNPGLGAWTYAIVENVPPTSPEPIRVYMSNEADLVMTFKSDQERYTLQNDQTEIHYRLL